MYHTIEQHPSTVTMKMMYSFDWINELTNYYTKGQKPNTISANMNVYRTRREQVNSKTLLKFTFLFHICSVSKQIQKKKKILLGEKGTKESEFEPLSDLQ